MVRIPVLETTPVLITIGMALQHVVFILQSVNKQLQASLLMKSHDSLDEAGFVDDGGSLLCPGLPPSMLNMGWEYPAHMLRHDGMGLQAAVAATPQEGHHTNEADQMVRRHHPGALLT